MSSLAHAAGATADLNLPTLVSVDTDLAAAVIRTETGQLGVFRRGESIESGRWKIDGVAAGSVVLVPTASDDRENGTRIRLFVESANTPPLIVRLQPPETPLAPRLVLQPGRVEPASATAKPKGDRQ